jgi:Yip1 domain
MSVFQNIYGVLFRPSKTFADLDANYNSGLLTESLILLILVNLISRGFDLGIIFGSFVNWLFLTTLVFLSAYVFVLSKQDYPKTLCLLAFANLPMIFLGPSGIFNSSMPLLTQIIDISVIVWVFNLNLIALSTICKIKKSKCVILYMLLPLALSYLFLNLAFQLINELVGFL